MKIELPNLPYAYDALEPALSAETLRIHHQEHHGGYVRKLIAAVEDTPFKGDTLESIVEQTAGTSRHESIFNNAAQAWNHTFFWHSLSPTGGGAPNSPLLAALESSFGSFEAFEEAFKEAAASLFGSGWVWLITKEGKLAVCATQNAATPWLDGLHPLITCDLWEHAYYLDHKNDRGAFVDAFLKRLINWDFAASNFAMQAAQEQEPPQRQVPDPQAGAAA